MTPVAPREKKPAKEFSIQAMSAEHVTSSAQIVGQLDLFEHYNFGPQACARLLTAELTRGVACLLVALGKGDQTAGFAWFVPRGGLDRSGYLRLIAVDPAWAGHGVGKALLNELERRFLNPTGILLLASEINPGAHRFYEAMGYGQVGTIPDYVRPGLDERIYYKAPAQD